ncbi:cytochrome P450 [Allokutzneria sp. A3M-2-11 16]|uniref:cytochrome P450 n=1 Tax=Allokutzneria sp. A3M-2-11 16 TaxID=2962043 RepID=UPI0020B87975|nr:cytochrome P450 [Allokutzneria sp. A3M-2-11 16]MCP3802007.1 cytochrome P450 [Allokutzneria sp. A3M-2-11 16]
MPDAPRVTEDPFVASGSRIGDRPAVHDTLRRAGPLVQVEVPVSGPVWIVTEDALAREVLSDPRFAKDPALAPAHWHGLDPSLEPPASEVRSLTTLDGTEHRRLRSAHAPAFTRRRLLLGRDRIATIARDLLTELAEESSRTGEPTDLVARFTTHYPLMVICDLLGVPLDDLAQAKQASEAMTHGDAAQVSAGFGELEAMVAAAIRTSKERDTGTLTDLIAERARAEFDVSDDELLYMITGLIFAGQVTTESFLGFLLAHQLAGHLVTTGDDDDDAIDAFVTEALRLYPPSPFTLWRFTTTEIDIAGVTLPAGAPVLVDIEGINTGPSHRPAPCAFDPGRPPQPDLTFGDGPHVCIGAQLALLEARVVIAVLREDFPDAHLAVPFAELERDPSVHARRLAGLPTWLRRR